jgi:FkbM family methyltransferase
VSDAELFASFWNIIFPNNWEDFTFEVLDHYLHPDKNYLDIGAWVGPTVLYAANKSKHTFGIEPDPIAFQELQKNIELNPSIEDKITIINKAISHKSGTKKLFKRVRFGDSSSSLIPTLSEEDFHIVSVFTLKELVKEFKVDNLSLIKVDIEGGEYFLVPAMRSYLKKYKLPFYLSLHPNFLKSFLEKKYSTENDIEKSYLKFVNRLVKSLDMYEFIYDSNGRLIEKKNLQQLLNGLEEPAEFLFTSTPWNK